MTRPTSLRRGGWWLLAIAVFVTVFAAGGALIWRLTAPPFPPPDPSTTPSPAPATSRSNTEIERPIKLLDAGSDPVYLQTATSIYRLDPSTGKIAQTATPSLTQFSTFVAGRDWVASKTVDNSDGVMILEGTPAKPLPDALRPNGRLFAATGNQIWLVPEDSTNGVRIATQHDVKKANEPTATLKVSDTFDLFYPDGTGHLLGQNAGGIYQITPGGARRITHGELIAIGGSHVLAWDCDARASCKPFLITRSTGQRAAIPGIDKLYGPDISQTSPGAISPDGRYAALRLPNTTDDHWPLAVVDLKTGRSHLLPGSLAGTNPNDQFTWAANSRYLFALTDQHLRAYDPTSQRTRTITITQQPLLHLTAPGGYTS